MWIVVLKILSILGIILLCLLAFLLTALLLVLFWPVSYQGGGSARAGEYRAWFKARWLFGLLRGTYAYPGNDGLQVKALWLTIYDSGGKQEKSSHERKNSHNEKNSHKKKSSHKKESSDKQTSSEPDTEAPKKDPSGKASASPKQADGGEEGRIPSGQTAIDSEERMPSENMMASSSTASSGDGGHDGTGDQAKAAGRKTPPWEGLSGLKEKIQFYLGIVRDEDNQGLVKHGLARLGRIIRSLRPRYLRVEALVGLGEPDLTGYVYGIYWAVMPFLGKKCHVAITPDFEQRILEGEAVLGGRITVAVILFHAARVLLDRRLRRLIRQFKQ